MLIDHRILLLPLLDLPDPGPDLARLDNFIQFFQDHPNIADHRNINPNILLQRSRIDIDMSDFRVGSKLTDLSGYPVVKAGAYRDDQI